MQSFKIDKRTDIHKPKQWVKFNPRLALIVLWTTCHSYTTTTVVSDYLHIRYKCFCYTIPWHSGTCHRLKITPLYCFPFPMLFPFPKDFKLNVFSKTFYAARITVLIILFIYNYLGFFIWIILVVVIYFDLAKFPNTSRSVTFFYFRRLIC